jgi:hypothetical protein
MALQEELKLPQRFEKNERFGHLLLLLAADAIQTPRDIRRLVGTFHVLAEMLYGEVDWVDLLAYSALLIKAPGTVAKMRRDPEDFSDELMSRRAVLRMARGEKQTIDERLNELIPPTEVNDCTKSLVRFLFPSLSESFQQTSDHPDALYRRRPLLNTLRLGLLPGLYSRERVQALFTSEPQEIKIRFDEAYQADVLDALTDRIDDLYDQLPQSQWVTFWRGIAAFCKKPDCEWITTYNLMHEKIKNIASILEQAVNRNKGKREAAANVFSHLKSDGESELIATWIRTHVFAHNLFGNRGEGDDRSFLDYSQTTAMVRELVTQWRTQHLAGKLLPCQWDLQPVYTMVDADAWDDPCRKLLDEMMGDDDKALDAFTLMLYGGPYSTGREMVSKICNLEAYLRNAATRLNASTDIDATVKVALQKAVGRGV